MKVVPFIVERFAKYILGEHGGVYFEGFKRVVAIAEDSGLKGRDKFNLALAEFEKLGYNLTILALNIGIELAVIYLNSKNRDVKINNSHQPSS